MELIVFILSIWLIGSGLKSLSRIPKARPAKTKIEYSSNTCYTALTALQEQRDLITEMITDIDTELDYCPAAKQRYTLLNRKQQLLNKLATVESKITKLIS